MFAKLLVRDLAIGAAAFGLWKLAAPLSAGGGALGDFVGLLVGLALGACAFLAHEWGHLLGALATGSEVRAAQSLRAAFLFSFDSRANSRRQFLVMSFAGFAATALAIWASFALLPSEWLASHVARGLVLVLAFLGVVLEFPLVGIALFGGKVPRVETQSHRPAQRAAA